MSKKQLDIGGITNELEGASLFFTPRPQPADPLPSSITKPEPVDKPFPTQEPKPQVVGETPVLPVAPEPPKKEPTHPVEKPERKTPIKRDSMKASMLDNNSDQLIEDIRKSVKAVGKESVFVRMTPEEKRELAAVVYSFNEMYRDEGRKTSENEAVRIAVRFMLADYQQNGQNSVLARVLAALNA